MLIGHNQQLEHLKKAAESEQLASAYLLSGLDGIGKKMAVKEFSVWLLKTTPERIENNSHPDFLLVSAEEDKRDLTIEQMREMQSKIQMHPLEAKHKVIIINDAEKMNQAAANSILKILEEPPSATHFFLISSRPHMLLPTINSRCQKMTFSPPPLEVASDFLQKNKNIDVETAKIISTISCGSIGLALSFPENILKDILANIQKIWKNISPAEILSIAESWAKADEPWAILATLLAIYRDVLAFQAAGIKSSFGAMIEDAPRYDASNKIRTIISAQNDLESSYNKQLLFEQLLFELS